MRRFSRSNCSETGRHTAPSRGRLHAPPDSTADPTGAPPRHLSIAAGRASLVTLLPVARGRRDARPGRRTKHWNLTPQSSRPHRSVQRRNNLLLSAQMTSPRSGRTRGNVSRPPRRTTGQRLVRTAPKSGSTWAPSLSRTRRPRRSCMSFVIGTTRGCTVAATSSSPRARRTSGGTAANDARVRGVNETRFGNVQRTKPISSGSAMRGFETINLCRRC